MDTSLRELSSAAPGAIAWLAQKGGGQAEALGCAQPGSRRSLYTGVIMRWNQK
jgi:hypothetical protein